MTRKRVLEKITFSIFVIAVFFCFITPSFVSAHELRPAYLELHEEKPGEFNVTWKVPMRGEMRLSLNPEFSIMTENMTPVMTRQIDNAALQTWRMKPAESLRGKTIRIAGLEGTMTDALVRFEFLDGSTWVKRLSAAEPEAAVPDRLSGWYVAAEYFKLGVEHILTGIDHLLFVLALLLMTQGIWRIVKTVSAFTLSHCLTLTAATLGWVRMPQRPVEAVIALSIVFVAQEIIYLYSGKEGLTSRAPWVVAFTFGLLHGLGFAGALSETGLPVGHIPTALLFFSVGVETGHLLFVAFVLSLAALLSRIRVRLPQWVKIAPAYAIGSIAMFWTIERVLTF